LEEIVAAALHRLTATLGDRPVRVTLPPDLPLISVDDVLIEQVLINLFENAAKYTPEHSEISISALQREDNVVLEIGDRGPGFPPGDEERVWEKFYRAQVEGVRGVGLGLTICRAIISATAVQFRP
jgi:two-component system sensor histidine kinase KdpD